MFCNPHLIKSSTSYSKSCKSTTDDAVPVNYQDTLSLSINPSSPRRQKLGLEYRIQQHDGYSKLVMNNSI